ncbi:hypothetical protein DQG23_04085 [Paenibacillus contaminans]|uniref:Uncharacterized protein n=1 Tax=Paenibacillus contaminans TaxID=450362 RepID=A0A329MUZ7_9BACL|nr:hypothetical protein DQG23_04085 [Paenibacillus contaminans]
MKKDIVEKLKCDTANGNINSEPKAGWIMKITYEIKTLQEFKELPLISKIGICLFFLSGLWFGGIIICKIFNIEIPLFFMKDSLIFLPLLVSFFSLIIAILFDKNRKKRVKIGPKRP